MLGSSLSKFCGQPFGIWHGSSFSKCFETFVFVLGPFLLLALTSAYYIGRLRPPDITLKQPSNFNLRRMCTGITLLITVIAFLKDVIMIKSDIQGVIVLSYCTRIVALLVHFVFLFRLGLIHFEYKHGPSIVNIAWLLTFVFYGVQMERIIVVLLDKVKQHDDLSDEVSVIIDIFCFAAMLACQVTYLVTVFQKNPRYRTVSFVSHVETVEYLTPSLRNNSGERYFDVSTSDLPILRAEQDCPVDSAYWPSKLFFCWVQKLMTKGSKKLLQNQNSVYQLPQDLSTKHLCEGFSNELHDSLLVNACTSYVRLSDDADEQPKSSRILLKSLHKQFGRWYYLLGFVKLTGDALGFAGPILLNKLVNFVEVKEPLVNGFYYALGLFASTLVGSLLTTHFDYQVNKVSIAIKSSLIGAVYTKTMQAKPVALSTYSTGEVTNFMSTDVNRVVNFCPSFHQFWSLPFQVIVTLVLLNQQVGIVFLTGLGIALIMILFNRYLAKKIGEYNQNMMKYKDSRVKLMTEILLGIRVIKFNVWEAFLGDQINSIRTEELKSLRGIKYFDAGCVYLWATTPVLISLLIFSIYASMAGHVLTAARVFTVIALINMLISPLNAFPWVINGLMEAWVSLDRLEKFVALPDLILEDYYDAHVTSDGSDHVLDIKNGTFAWNSDVSKMEEDNETVAENGRYGDKDLMLQNLSLSVKKGQFIGVIGSVGSGKSSLLSAISAGMEKIDGGISLYHSNDGVALVSQEPWIQHATIKENILWNKQYNQEFYDAVVECCALKEDFAALPDGDLTEVGENGVTLSGGQKARVALARAIYQDKSIYLLDDPLSAVDQHVASHLYHQCIAGILRDRTRILCTHHTKYLKNADMVIAMNNGRIESFGSPSEILGIDISEDGDASLANTDGGAAKDYEKDSSNEDDRDDDGDRQRTSLVTIEEKASGTVAPKVYKAYWLAIGGYLSFTILIFVVLMQGSKVASDWWLSNWVNSNETKPPGSLIGYDGPAAHNVTLSNHTYHHHIFEAPLILTDASYTFLLTGDARHEVGNVVGTKESKHSTAFYLEIYGGIAAANSLFTFIRAFAFAYGGICAAKVIHQQLLSSILRAPISFFDVTPIGRIINRFSSDMYTIDDSLPFMLNIFLAQFAGLVATIVVTCYGLPWFAFLLLPLSIFYYYTQRYYRLTSRELKRFSSISLSPIYAHFTESLMGVDTIRAFRKTDTFRKRNIELIEMNQRCNFSSLAAQEWLAIRLQMMGVVMVTGVAFTAVLVNKYSSVPAGMVGLALSYALSVTGRLSGVITSFTETEKQMVAVERQSYYICNVPQERTAPLHEFQLRTAWPSGGGVEFKRVSLKYRPNLPLALDEVTFRIEPGEKIGVVGRTGSGKSSLFLTLFGMVPLTSGGIYVDGVNTHKVPLRTLRSKMSIIPQDPFIFSDSLRSNLDPTGEAGEGPEADAVLWWALENCGLRKTVENMGGLDTEAGERGRRLSVGQRQLLCLARSLLKDVQIICLDEATANVDRESDTILQETIKRNFSRCTVITIAHRIETVMNSDRVLVMDGGRLAEFDPPGVLLLHPESLFSRLVKRSEIEGAHSTV